jgi:hypothetical protein
VKEQEGKNRRNVRMQGSSRVQKCNRRRKERVQESKSEGSQECSEARIKKSKSAVRQEKK